MTVFFLRFSGGYRDQPGLNAQGAEKGQVGPPGLHACVRLGLGWAGQPAVGGQGWGILCSADNCHALYCTRP